MWWLSSLTWSYVKGLCGKNLKVVGFRVKLTATTRDDATERGIIKCERNIRLARNINFVAKVTYRIYT